MVDKKRIYVGMPSGTGFPYPDVIINILQQEMPRWYELVFYKDHIINGRPIHIARNLIVSNFIRSDCDYLWFCDDDNPPSIDALKYLISCNEDVASALVPLRHWGYTLNLTVDGKWLTSIAKYKGKKFEVENFGTGCVLLSRKIIEDVCNATWQWPYHFYRQIMVINNETNEKEEYTHQDLIPWWHNTYEHDNFEIHKEYIDWSEDLHFGKIARELGYKFYAHPRARCRHYLQNRDFIWVKNQ